MTRPALPGLWLALLGCSALGLAGCSRLPPSVLLVTIDTLRADAVGPQAGVTPVLDRLAAAGTVFTRATSVTPLTLPSHASLLTGVRPGRHGLTVNGLAVEQLPVPTLAETLEQAGYATAAFVSSAMLDRRHGLDRGFALYDDELSLPGGPPRPHERLGEVTAARAAAWLEAQRGPWFAWVHLYDPHAPYSAPGGRLTPARAAYLDEVAYADAQLEPLLAALDRAGGEVLVVVTSDHGEGLGEHGEQTHGLLLYESTLHVPLVFARRGGGGRGFPQPGATREDVVALLDVAPTILEWLGLPPGPPREGRSLLAPGPPRSLPLEARAGWFYYGFSPLVGVRHGALKLLGAPQAEPAGWTLHDLASDPDETAGQPAADHPLRAAVLPSAPVVAATSVTDEETLRALGYLGSSRPAECAGSRRDPRQAMELIEALDRAHTRLADGDPRGALELLEPRLGADADVAEVQLLVGQAYRALGRFSEARVALDRALALQPASLGALHELAKVLMEQAEHREGAAEELPQLLARADELLPGDPDTAALRGLYEVLYGDPARALEWLGPALARRPRAHNLLQVQARALRALGREDEARAVEALLGDG